MSSRTMQAIEAQFYAIKGLETEPAKAIKFIRKNKEFFPTFTTELINQVIKDNNLTEEDIINSEDIELSKPEESNKKESNKKESNKKEARFSVNLKEEVFTPVEIKEDGEWKKI